MIRDKLPKHVHVFTDRRGARDVQRIYLRRPGHKQVPLPGPLYSPAFLQAYEAARAQPVPPVGAGRTKPGTFNALLAAFYASTDFTSLAPSTQRAFRNIYEKLRNLLGDEMVAKFRREHVVSMMQGMAKTPAAANGFRKRLKKLMRFAIASGLRDDDPTLYVKPIKYKTTGYPTWEEDDIEKFKAAHPLGTRPRLALELLLCTGQRRSDVVRMGRQHVRDGYMGVRQHKTWTFLEIPIHVDLSATIDATPSEHLTFLTTDYGRPFTPAGFGNWFRDQCDAAGLHGLAAHGLRKAMCRRLAEAGCTTLQIMAITGHKNIREVETYVQAANQKLMARDAMTKLETGTKTGNAG